MLIGYRRKRRPHRAWAPLRLWQMVWVVLAPATIGLGLVLAWSGLLALQVPWPRSYVGTLRPANALAPVVLPADIPVKMVLVERGELVTPGQTLVVLDKAAMEARLKSVNRSLLAARVLRTCFFNWQEDLHTPTTPTAGYITALDPEDRFSLQAAQRECAMEKTEARQSQAELTQTRAIMQERLQLAEGRLALALTGAPNPSPENRASRAYEALSAAHARSLLQEELLQLDQAQARLMLAMDTKMLERARTVSLEVESLVELHARLTKFAAEPRLHAPEGGRIVRVRPTGQALVFLGDIVLVEIEQTGSMEFVASMRLPLADARALVVGQPVKIRALGMGVGHVPLAGALHALLAPEGRTRRGQVIAQVILSDDSTARLNDARKGVALHGRETASAIQIEIASRSLQSTLTQTGRLAIGNSSIRLHLFLARLRSPPSSKTPEADFAGPSALN